MDPNQLSFLERSLLERRTVQHAEIRYLEISAIVTAVLEAAKLMSAGGAASQTNDALKALKSLLLPHLAEKTEKSAEEKRHILEREHAAGPITIQSLDYNKRKPKKRR